MSQQTSGRLVSKHFKLSKLLEKVIDSSSSFSFLPYCYLVFYSFSFFSTFSSFCFFPFSTFSFYSSSFPFFSFSFYSSSFPFFSISPSFSFSLFPSFSLLLYICWQFITECTPMLCTIMQITIKCYCNAYHLSNIKCTVFKRNIAS